MVRNVQPDQASQAALDLLKERAAQAGMPLKQYIDELDREVPESDPAEGSRLVQGSPEWIRAFREWVESHPRVDHFVDDSRESIYPDRC